MIKAGPADALMMSHKVWARPIRCYQRVGTLLLFLQPAHQRSWSFPLSLLQDFFFGLPLGRGTPKREVAAPCAASWAKKAVSSMTSPVCSYKTTFAVCAVAAAAEKYTRRADEERNSYISY